MANYSERIEYKKEILPNQTIQLRTATITSKDGVEIGRSYQRAVYVPGSDVTNAPEDVQAIAAALWSPEVVAAYAQSISTDLV